MKLRNTKPKIVVQLCGGLGNQMFQYAAARSIADRNGAELVLDTWSGFVRDFQYKRHYELASFPISARTATLLERLPFWIERISKKLLRVPSRAIHEHWYGVTLNETCKQFLPRVFDCQMKASCWMTGYWQSAKYFAGHEVLIQRELSPPVPTESHILALGKNMRAANSVAVGVRLYEESRKPAAQSANGELKSVASINHVIQAMKARQPSCCFFIFCTHRSPFLEQLQFEGDVTFVTHDDGYKGTLQCLWLLTQCRHHIMTNSSYYWWGAWLSQNHYHDEKQEVFMANNFINKDSALPQWQLF